MADPGQPGTPDEDPRDEGGSAPDQGAGFRAGGPSGAGGSGTGGSGTGGSGTGGSGTGGSGTGGSGTGGSGAGENHPQNPLEALFAQFGLTGGGSAGAPDLGAMLQQLQGAFSSMGGQMTGLFGQGQGQAESDSGVNWALAKDTARKVVAGLGADPTPSHADVDQITDAVSIAEVWLDDATDFPRVGTSPQVWSRAEWVEQTMPIWRRLVEPVATHIADAMAATVRLGDGEAAEAEMAGMADMEKMLRPMLRSSGASMFGLQLGQALGRLATEVVGTTDIGLPLHDRVALLPTNIASYGEGLDQTLTDITLYLALRECARQRLFAGVGWLRSQLLSLVESYARGITIDTSALEQALGEVDPSNLTELSSALEGGLFEPHKTPEQEAVLVRLETMLALVEGWVDEVVAQATLRWMPAAGALAETVRRTRATGGPAEATFATLVGLELRPRRMRDAANLWAALREARGVSGRDAVWKHPDIAPGVEALDDPIGFVRGDPSATGQGGPAAVSDFDAELAKLLDAEDKMDDADETATGGHNQPDDDKRDDEEPGDTGPTAPPSGS